MITVLARSIKVCIMVKRVEKFQYCLLAKLVMFLGGGGRRGGRREWEREGKREEGKGERDG